MIVEIRNFAQPSYYSPLFRLAMTTAKTTIAAKHTAQIQTIQTVATRVLIPSSFISSASNSVPCWTSSNAWDAVVMIAASAPVSEEYG